MGHWDLLVALLAPHLPTRPAPPTLAQVRSGPPAALRREWLRRLAEAQTLEVRAARLPRIGPEQIIAQAAQDEWRRRADAAWRFYAANSLLGDR